MRRLKLALVMSVNVRVTELFICVVAFFVAPQCAAGGGSSEEGKSISEMEMTVNGFFWQVTDFHFDVNYTKSGDPSQMCHSSNSGVGDALGEFGDYSCDAPWALVKSAIEAMKHIDSYPDFILWTGDSIPHINTTSYDKDKVYLVVQAVTNALRDTFNYTPIYPSFGNHDPYPTNQMPIADETYYNYILNFSNWDELIPSTARTNFLKGGYYSTVYGLLRIVNLNTALYYRWNNITVNHTHDDPTGQLSWLESELTSAKAADQKVIIAAHVPPGAFEKGKVFKWFHDGFNSAYLDLVSKHQDVIAGHFYGHEHTDSFRVLYKNSRKLLHPRHKGGADPIGVMFLSPAVTPWRSTLPGVGANNPSIRLYEYEIPSGRILNYRQYYLNLTLANQGNVTWQLEYSFVDAYDVPDISPKSAHDAINNIFQKKDKYLEKYLLYNSVSANTKPGCNDTCLRNHLCAMSVLRYEEYDLCMSGSRWHHHQTTRKPHTHTKKLTRYMIWALAALAVSIFCLALVMMCICVRQRRYVMLGRGFTHYAPQGYGTISS